MAMITEETILQVLGEVSDPESGRSLVQMGQVHSVQCRNGVVQVHLGLTSWAAPLWKETQARVMELVRTRLPEVRQVDVTIEVHDRPAEKVGPLGISAKTVVAVGSGKGGVGKSTVAAILAVGLARSGAKVGLMDADVYGPSIPHLLGSQDRPTLLDRRIQPVQVEGMRVMSIGFLVPPGEAVIWRGPMLHQYLTQFLRDTEWGGLDYLIVDMPPGTGDVAISLSQLLPLSGAVVVCTPQDVALLDATKAIAMFRKLNIEVLGMVENMSHFICTQCGARHDIFGSGGARLKSQELGIPFLGEIPLNTQLRVYGDAGQVAASFEVPESAPYLEGIVYRLVKHLAQKRETTPPLPPLSVL